MSDAKSFIDAIEKYIESGKVNLPVFNPNAMRVQQELVRKEPNMNVIEKLIVRDQTLASEVLKLANSSFYRGLVEVKTVKAAIIRLGMREIGRIVLLAASKTQFRITDKELSQLMKKLWQHSAGNGLAANWLAKKCNFDELAGQAFFAGLLHDIGKLFLVTVIEQSKLRKSGQMTSALLMEVIDTLHTKQGYNLMKLWNMPEEYCVIVRDHHLPEVDIKNTLLILIRLADMVCHKLSIGIHSLPDINLAATVEAHTLDLTEVELAELEIMLEDTKALVQ
jgi:HD-like signal output (HDOD) protein